MQEETFAIRAKTELLKKKQSIAALARKLRRSRHAVSQAINHSVFPKLRDRIKKELAIK